MIPPPTREGLLPPFTGTVDHPTAMSPYEVSIQEFVSGWIPDEQRAKLLGGLIQFRKALRAQGLVEATQWIGGSFLERRRTPRDIDVVTFLDLDEAQQQRFSEDHPDLCDPEATKAAFGVHGHVESVASLGPRERIEQIVYWYGLFSHQRDTFTWKGILSLKLGSDDDDEGALNIVRTRWPHAL